MSDANGKNTSRNRKDQAQLEVNAVTTYYGEAVALKRVSFSVHGGEIVTVLGSNGAGKTTLLRTITGVLSPRSGKITFNGNSIDGLRASETVRRGISSVPEGGELFGPMTVADNLLLGTYPLCKTDRKQMLQQLMDMAFETFPVLKQRHQQTAETLSGGERQMLAVARALMSNPRLIALDEPSLGLSPLLVGELMKLLKHICHKMQVSILLVEQNAKAALSIADYAYVLERGEIVLEGTSQAVAADPTIFSAYLGG